MSSHITTSPRLCVARLCVLCSVSKSQPRALLADSKMNTHSDEMINQLKLGTAKLLFYIHKMPITYSQETKLVCRTVKTPNCVVEANPAPITHLNIVTVTNFKISIVDMPVTKE